VSPSLRRNLTALLSGLVFGVGLVVSGMTEPAKVLAFLDPFGAWDPSLALVMAAALGISAPAFRLSFRRRAPLAAQSFSIPAGRGLDPSLVGGATLFGLGWGLSGYCPGPSVVSLVSGGSGVVTFVSFVLVGIALAARFERRASAQINRTTALGAGSV
jgi:uncharacterized membrane protein YedE/YeeE